MKTKAIGSEQDIILPIGRIRLLGISINEYLILYDLVNDHEIKNILSFGLSDLVSLESKGFIKLGRDGITIRDKSTKLFAIDGTVDLFTVWLSTYPVKVDKKYGGSRALSPSSENTILGRKLKKKWESTFRKDTNAMRQAIEVLEIEVENRTKSGDLEYMVEATRWLNEGFHEKYAYMIDERKEKDEYGQEDHY